MFKNVKDLKEFILWAKKQKIKSFQADEIQFELSEIAFAEDLYSSTSSKQKEVTDFEQKTWVDSEESSDPKEEEDLLFWSANK